MFCVLPCSISGQTITTFAGTGTAGNSGYGNPATTANIAAPSTGTFDKSGNFFFISTSGSDRLSKVDVSGTISLIAGGIAGSGGFSGDGGSASAATFNKPQAVAIDRKGNLYIADAYNNRIRKIDISTNVISTFAGNGGTGLVGDGGPATSANVYNPLDVCFDKKGNLYIAEAQHYRIRKVDTNGIISTFAGIGGAFGFSGDGGPATTALLSEVWGICADNQDNLYLADFGNGRVRKVSTAGIISTIAGKGGSMVQCGDGGPATAACVSPERIAIDNFGNLYVTSYISNRVRIITSLGIINTFAGTGVGGYNGDNGSATAAQLNYPSGLAIDSCGNLYIADLENARIRKVYFEHCDYLKVESTRAESNEISIYPNPAIDQLHIDNISENTSCVILNPVGSKIFFYTLSECNNLLSIKSLPSGVYFLELKSESGERTVTRVVKE